jgi:hypothetical protein
MSQIRLLPSVKHVTIYIYIYIYGTCISGVVSWKGFGEDVSAVTHVVAVDSTAVMYRYCYSQIKHYADIGWDGLLGCLHAESWVRSPVLQTVVFAFASVRCPELAETSVGRVRIVRTALHCTALYYTTLQYAALHCATLHYTALHYTTLHCTLLHYTALHYTALYCTALYYTTLQYATLHYVALHYTTLHYTAQSWIEFREVENERRRKERKGRIGRMKGKKRTAKKHRKSKQ